MEQRTRCIQSDISGGIEGLPLQLMIMILVATLGTAVIIGWMGSIETPHAIGDVEVEPESILATNGVFGFTVYVEDQDGNPLSGATVLVTNVNVKDSEGRMPLDTTSSDGTVIFSGLTMERHGNTEFLKINVSKPDYGEKDNIRVVVRF